MFSCAFYEISKNTSFTEHLPTTASGLLLTIDFLFKNIEYTIKGAFFGLRQFFDFQSFKNGEK